VAPISQPQLAFQSADSPALDPPRGEARVIGRLEWDDDEQSREAVEVFSGVTRIGRSATADLRIASPMLARIEARITADGDRIEITSERTRGALRLNGAELETSPLVDGDVIEIPGELRLVFRIVQGS
jgi:pSer/pThr/pTyr-binding forkhead associated (FHA) protein